MKRGAETNPFGALRGRRKHRQWVRRDREFLEKMVINDGVDVEAAGVGVLDLAHNFPGEIVMRLARRRLHLAIDSEPHLASHFMDTEFSDRSGQSHAAETCGPCSESPGGPG